MSISSKISMSAASVARRNCVCRNAFAIKVLRILAEALAAVSAVEVASAVALVGALEVASRAVAAQDHVSKMEIKCKQK